MKVYKQLQNGVKIIEYENRFAAGLADMLNKSKESWGGGSELHTEQSTIDFYRGSSFLNVYLAVLETDSGTEVIGICSVAKYYKDADALYVHLLNVLPEYHGKGIGKALTLMAVDLTIAAGSPRLEIHTWPGNVKAVPLYKKCGFMWEDNSETTHLSNFIPAILQQGLLKPYFDGADWYSDSVRSLDIKPDGVISDNFEFFTYEWLGDGKSLSVTFEKFGRNISRVENDDFVLELRAENHELACGFDYKAKFLAVNKSGKPLDITFEGVDDGCISFDCAKRLNVTDSARFEAEFTVNQQKHRQDPYRKHPCVLARLSVNGLPLEMGLGIEAKPPLSAEFYAQRSAPFAGQEFEAHISVSSALLTDAEVRLSLPENEYIEFAEYEHGFNIPATGKYSICVPAKVLKTGYAGLPVKYEITLKDGRKAAAEKVLDVLNHGLTGSFCADTEKCFVIGSGAYRLAVYKNSNYGIVYHALDYELDVEFPVSKLGLPYDDEFGLAVPSDVKFNESADGCSVELSYLSAKQENITMTVIFDLSASGIIRRRHRVKNNGSETRDLFLSETVYTGFNHNSVCKYDGRFTASPRFLSGDSFEAAEAALLEENWIFTDNRPFSSGVCWDLSLKPTFRWGDGIVLEHKLHLPSGESVETPPVTACIGLFGDYQAFRNFALGTYNPHTEPTVEPLELIVNGHNPIFSGTDLDIRLKNNRSIVYEGEITLTAVNSALFWDEAQENPDELVEENVFTVQPFKAVLENSGIGVAKLRTDFPIQGSETSRALFFPAGKLDMAEKDGVLAVNNGLISYKCDPSYYAGVFSLKDKHSEEWLLSKYPAIEPFEWWNPFIGGMRVAFDKMNPGNVLKETASAEFTEIRDCFGNAWQGIKTKVTVVNNKELKGLTYEQYYLTMPGIPVLCSFTRFTNSSGGYLQFDTQEAVFCKTSTDEKDYVCDVSDKGKSRRFIAGGACLEYEHYEFARVRKVRGNVRLHTMPNHTDRRSSATIDDDQSTLIFGSDYDMGIPNNKTFITRPTFLIFAEFDLSADELVNLQRVIFPEEAVNENN